MSTPPIQYKVGQTVRYLSYGFEKTAVIVRIGERSGIVFLSGGRFVFRESILGIVDPT
jgi:hypothetical protein